MDDKGMDGEWMTKGWMGDRCRMDGGWMEDGWRMDEGWREKIHG